MGLAADLGTLQRLPRVVNNDSWTREVCFTGRTFTAMEAKQVGLLGGVFENQDEMMSKQCYFFVVVKERSLEEIWKLAKSIASKSPVAVMGTKQVFSHFYLQLTLFKKIAELFKRTWNNQRIGIHFCLECCHATNQGTSLCSLWR